jgi:hypothetical protein
MTASILNFENAKIPNPIIINDNDSKTIKIAKISVKETNTIQINEPLNNSTGNSIILYLLLITKESVRKLQIIEKITIHNLIK